MKTEIMLGTNPRVGARSAADLEDIRRRMIGPEYPSDSPAPRLTDALAHLGGKISLEQVIENARDQQLPPISE